MKLFKKIRKDHGTAGQESPRAPEMLSGQITKMERKLARWLGCGSEKLSPRGKKISLLLFGTAMGGISLMLIADSFHSTAVNASVFPQAPAPPPMPPVVTRPLLTREEFNKLIDFRRMIDSLGQTPEGRLLREEILGGRTGLLDSVDLLLSIYRTR